MSLNRQSNPSDAYKIQSVLKVIFSQTRPPVARCRLLSAGLGSANMLKTEDNLAGSKACLGCGCCMDACPLLARDPKRRQRMAVRSSMALETLVGEDCDRCGNCALACPQVDVSIKQFLVQTHLAEGMSELLAKAATDEVFVLDLVLSR